MSTPLPLRFARHELLLWRRAWYGSAFSTFVAPVLYLTSIGLGLGTIVADGGTSAALGGVTFAAFAGTGLMAGAAMQTGAGDLSWPIVGAIGYTRTWYAAVASPLRPRDVLAGRALVTALRLVISSTVFGVVLAVLGLVPPAGAALAVLPAVLTGLAVGLPVSAVAAGARRSQSVSSVTRFGITPMFILSGTFFPVSELPDAVQPVAVVSPLWHGVELLRAAALDLPAALPAAVHVVVLVAWVVVGGVVAERVLRRRLQP